MKHKIYIAGKVTGENTKDCTAKFEQAQSAIESRGFEALNPIEIIGSWETPWNVAMKQCIAKLTEADAVVLLPDWQFSAGATLEKELAMKLGIPIYESDFFGFEKLERYLWNK